MITERARRILSEGAYDNPDGENTVIVAEGETTTVFRVFRARHTLYDTRKEATTWLLAATYFCTSSDGELRTNMVCPQRGPLDVMAGVTGTNIDVRGAREADDPGTQTPTGTDEETRMRVAIYTQDIPGGESADDQMEALLALTAGEDLEITREYEDYRHMSLYRMLGEATSANPPFDQLIVTDTALLGDTPEEVQERLQELNEKGIRVRTPEGAFHPEE